ncbi:hypothetical protein [Pseudochrobactrum sp. AO18b]|uniref:hypothetical protein n=1 Tax=Pseudochrobactrum sp. AO18b TaxID=1201036 RepID=UPI0003B44FD8|nr:hypothetical protein [Pseudochrobactrum sp. AO18b]
MRFGFFTGGLIGFVVGAISAPIIYEQVNVNGNFPLKDIIYGAIQPSDRTKWPNADDTLNALFEYQKWEVAAQSTANKASVDDCVTLQNNTFGCDITLKLAWLEKQTQISATFQLIEDKWKIINIQKNLP